MPKDRSKIPTGYYCYQSAIIDGIRTVQVCPYWSIRHDKEPKENGYCSYLERGDWEIGGLLWDQVKECGENQRDPTIKDIDIAYREPFTEAEQDKIQNIRTNHPSPPPSSGISKYND